MYSHYIRADQWSVDILRINLLFCLMAYSDIFNYALWDPPWKLKQNTPAIKRMALIQYGYILLDSVYTRDLSDTRLVPQLNSMSYLINSHECVSNAIQYCALLITGFSNNREQLLMFKSPHWFYYGSGIFYPLSPTKTTLLGCVVCVVAVDI